MFTACDKRSTAQARRNQGLFTIREAADLLGVQYQVFHYHVVRSHAPGPTTCWGRRGKRRYYTVADIARLQAVWNATT